MSPPTFRDSSRSSSCPREALVLCLGELRRCGSGWRTAAGQDRSKAPVTAPGSSAAPTPENTKALTTLDEGDVHDRSSNLVASVTRASVAEHPGDVMGTQMKYTLHDTIRGGGVILTGDDRFVPAAFVSTSTCS